MLLDLINTDNYVQFNKKLAHIIGLSASIYVNQIVTIMGKAIKKDKTYDDGFVLLDRMYIFNQTTITLEEQSKLDNNLMGLGLLVKNIDNPDMVKIDIQLLADMTSMDDETTKVKINRIMMTNRKMNKHEKNTQIALGFMEKVQIDDESLRSSLQKWIVSLLDANKQFNKGVLNEFLDGLYNYTKGDLDIALSLVDIASDYTYRDIKWAINKYETTSAFVSSDATDNDNLSNINF